MICVSPDPRLDALRARLSGTRQAAATTIAMCLNVCSRFLAWSNTDALTPEDVDKYFAYRRAAGISEWTLKNEFYQIRLLYEANHVDWPFDKGDIPQPKAEPKQPTLTPEQVRALILAQPIYTPLDRLYLAVSTTWACRASALAQLNKHSWDGETLTIPGVHGSKTVRHIVPDFLKPLFRACRLRPRTTMNANQIFRRIVKQAGVKLGHGFAWHSIRRRLDTDIEDALPLESKHYWSLSTGWSKEKVGRKHFNSPMAGHYYQPDFARIDGEIYQVHPFLKLWEQTLRESPPIVRTWHEIEDVPPEVQPAVAVAYAPLVSPPMQKESPLDRLIRELREG